MRVGLLDPSLLDHQGNVSPNVGDEVIFRSVSRVLTEIAPEAELIRVSTHVRPTTAMLRELRSCALVVVGGSNLLGNRVFGRRRMRYWQQWPLSISDARKIDRAILLGAGWRDYEDSMQRHTAKLLRTVLSHTAVHSVRDEYTRQRLAHVRQLNVMNTKCPTLWSLAESSGRNVSRERSRVALTTVTDYRKSPGLDAARIELLWELYDEVILWPQGEGDRDYVLSLHVPVNIIDAGLAALDRLIEETEFDYIGTRLHGGIHCLNAGKRTLIVAVDNRASEMLPGTGVPSVQAKDLSGVRQWVENPMPTSITIDLKPINAWKQQFRRGLTA